MKLKITPSELMAKQDELNKRIADIADDKELTKDDCKPIFDGVADTEQYLSSKKRIMWLMKEPYDDFDEEGNPKGGGWSIVDDCFIGYGEDGKEPKSDAWSNRSWQPIIYSLYGYFNNMTFGDMPYISDKKEMAHVLQKIAYINMSKMPSQKTSKHLEEVYDCWKDILNEQIELFKPEVLIFANTFDYYNQDLGLTDKEKTNYGVDNILDAYEKNGILYLDAYHPQQKNISREKYVDSIINAIQQFDENCR